ncbi:hypothetical protein BDZ97DRAFT_1917487 [Flammula alnicola]|nr:hypothetical protein BDZ97DRAFT_1917487 [Flammula alnicola]
MSLNHMSTRVMLQVHLGKFRFGVLKRPEIYAGCSNGELICFALQADDPNKLESYTVISTQTIPGDKPMDEIVLIPSLSRALVLSDHQIHFYTISSLDPFPIKPIRHVVTFTVDDQHLKRLTPQLSASEIPLPVEPVEFCVVKRSSIALYTMKDRLVYQKEIPLPQGSPTITLAILDLEASSLFQVIPLSQAFDSMPFMVKPSITVISQNEFLILSWTGASTLGLFITGDGDPVRGTLQWPSHREAICLDCPYITSLLPNDTIETQCRDAGDRPSPRCTCTFFFLFQANIAEKAIHSSTFIVDKFEERRHRSFPTPPFDFEHRRLFGARDPEVEEDVDNSR